MKNIIVKTLATVSTLIAASSAFAGSFDAYSMSDQKSGRLVLVVSFAGDGVVEEAQLDLDVPSGYGLVSSVAKVAGSVCVGIPGNKVRIVPPSGAGKPLTQGATDYCSFSFKPDKKLSAAISAANFKQSFIECASVSGVKPCDAKIADITK